MNANVRHTLVAAVVAVLASMALASPNVGLVACIDEGAASRASVIAATPGTVALTTEEEMQDLHERSFRAQVAQRQAAASDRDLLRALTAMGIAVT